jgi:hypothetical protein
MRLYRKTLILILIKKKIKKIKKTKKTKKIKKIKKNKKIEKFVFFFLSCFVIKILFIKYL